MLLHSLLLLPALVAARQHGVKGVHRRLQTTTRTCDPAPILACEIKEENKRACYGDDPGGEVCAKDATTGGGTFPDPGFNPITTVVDVDPKFYCNNAKNYFCASEACCAGKCKTEYRAYYQCQSNILGFDCGTYDDTTCAPPTAAPTPPPTRPPTPAPTPVPTGATIVSTPAPSAAPVQAPAPSGGGGGCFSATSTAQVLGRGPVQMQDLQVGDLVLTGSPSNYKYHPVYAFGHLNKKTLGAFYAIATKGSKKPLEMTGEHLVYLAGKYNPVRADSLVVGDTLLSTQGPTEITSIRTVKKKGLFNPLTADGRLVVDDIAVSTYIALQENNQEHFQVVFDKEGAIKVSVISHQSFVDLYLAPFRMLCMGISSQLCQVVDDEGIPLYISYGMKLVHYAGDQNLLVQLLFLLVTFPVVLCFWAMENMVGSSVAPLAFFVVALLANKAPKYLSMKKTKNV